MNMNEVAMSRRHIGGESPMVVSPLSKESIYAGLFGSIDSNRMAALTDKLIDAAESSQIRVAIIDLANVDAIDSSVANQLYRLADTVKLIGVNVIFCGIKGTIARTMVSSGVRMDGYIVVRDLQLAVEKSYEMMGLAIVERAE